MRAIFDYCSVVWMHDDRSIELPPLPLEWQPPDPRGWQIEESRRERGYVQPGEPAARYIANAHYPDANEIRDTWLAFEVARGAKLLKMEERVHGETDPKVIKAACAISKLRNSRLVKACLDDVGITVEDIEDARAAFDTIGMLRC